MSLPSPRLPPDAASAEKPIPLRPQPAEGAALPGQR